MLQRYFLSLFCFLLSLTASAQTVVVDARLDSAAIRVGEQLRMHATVNCEKGAKVIWPKFENAHLMDSLELLEISPIDTLLLNDGHRWSLSRSYLITAFDSATYKLPPFEVKVGDKVYRAQQLALKVNTIKVDEQHPDKLQDPHGPVEAEFHWTWHLLLLTLIVWLLSFLLIPLITRLLRRRPQLHRVVVLPPPPPHQQAIAAIEQLRAENHVTGEAQKAYYMQLTDVLRSYLHERFGFNAREMTTEEIIAALQQRGDRQALDELREVLSTADLVKFARYETSLIESDRALLQAVHYVQRTQQDEGECLQPREELVLVPQRTQLRWRRFWQLLFVLDALTIVLLVAYVCYELWMNFA